MTRQLSFASIAPPSAPLADAASQSPFGGLVWAPALRSRNDVRYLTFRAWGAGTRDADMSAFKYEKRKKLHVAAVARELAETLARLLGPLSAWSIVNVPCGHSRDQQCWGKLLARETAAALGARFVQAFADRFVSGSSHPKQFERLPPLKWIADLAGPVLVVDDIATSGWHLEEAATAIRGRGLCCLPCAWLGGTKVA